jgi:hypothetical protein
MRHLSVSQQLAKTEDARGITSDGQVGKGEVTCIIERRGEAKDQEEKSLRYTPAPAKSAAALQPLPVASTSNTVSTHQKHQLVVSQQGKEGGVSRW